jgi:serine/threonine protein kinase
MGNAAAWKGQEVLDGRYQLMGRLGEGGMGIVFRARDKRLQTDVVIKVPRCWPLSEEQFVPRFRMEVRALIHLAHPHIVTVLDEGEHDGLPYVVMRFLPGGSLEERTRAGHDIQALPMAQGALRGWLPDVASALDFIHRKGFIHRDVKPGNILFDADDNVYLSDFGLAKAFASLASGGGAASASLGRATTGAGMVFGTPQYMAPEAIRGQAIDGRADQYALAITVYELLAGRGPFAGLPLVQIAELQKAGQPPSLEAIDATILESVSVAVQKALAYDPAQRFVSCEAFAQAVLAGAPSDGAFDLSIDPSGGHPAPIQTPAPAPCFKTPPAPREAPSNTPFPRWGDRPLPLPGADKQVGLPPRKWAAGQSPGPRQTPPRKEAAAPTPVRSLPSLLPPPPPPRRKRRPGPSVAVIALLAVLAGVLLVGMVVAGLLVFLANRERSSADFDRSPNGGLACATGAAEGFCHDSTWNTEGSRSRR